MRVVLGSEEALSEGFMEFMIVMLGDGSSEEEYGLMLRKLVLKSSYCNTCYSMFAGRSWRRASDICPEI